MAMAAPKAQAASYFCGTTEDPGWVNPYGDGGDKCWGPAKYQLYWAIVRTYERAGCVTLAEGTDLLTSWVCGPAGSAPNGSVTVSKYNYSYNWKGVLRNNNLTYGTHINGSYECFLYHC